MPKIAIPVAASYQELVAAVNPSSAGGPETIPWWFYDTQTYTSGSTTELQYFAAQQSARDLGNLPTGGALPDPNFFAIAFINLDFMQNASGTPYTTTSAGATLPANTGALNDIGSLLLSGRGRFTLTLSDKLYGPWPLSVTGGTGAALGFLSDTNATTAAASQAVTHQFAYNALHGGAYIGNRIILPPKVGWFITADWPAALTLTGDYRTRFVLYGPYYRRVA